LFFKRIEIENFLSFAKAEFDFENGLILVEGKNGAGKSSLFADAICYCLTGVTTKGDKADDVVNWDCDGDCKVSLYFAYNSREYRVDRYRAYSGVDHKGLSFGNRLVYHRDDVLIEKSTMVATQSALLEEIKVDIELLKCTLILSQDNKFNFVDATDKQQKEILSKIRHVDFEDTLKAVKLKLNAIEAETFELKSKAAILKSHLVSPEKLEDMKKLADGFAEEVDAKMVALKRSRDEYNVRIKDANDALGKLDSVSEVAVNLKLTNAKEEMSQTLAKTAKLDTMINMVEKEIKGIGGLKDTCVTCGQDIDRDHAISLLAAKKRRRDALVQKKSEISVEAEELLILVTELGNEARDIRDSFREYDHRVKLLNSDKAAWLRLGTEIAEERKRENVYLKQYNDAVTMSANIRDKLTEVETKLATVDADVPYYLFWQKAFGDKGVKSFIFDSICGTLTSKANRFINFLTNGSISISFDTQSELKDGSIREKFECCIVKDGRKVAYRRYSGGEKRRVSLAVDMALSEIMSEFYGTKFNLLVLDEQSNYIDTEGKTEYFNLAKELSKDKCVIIIDHDSLLKTKFDRVITVKNTDGVSSIG